MKNNTNNDKLLQRAIDEKYFVLYQVWKELTDFRTRVFDTLFAP